jgi:hypothetical protein
LEEERTRERILRLRMPLIRRTEAENVPIENLDVQS